MTAPRRRRSSESGMRCPRTALALAAALLAACAGNPDKRTLAELHDVEPDVTDVQVENSLEQAMLGYRNFLAEAPESALTPEAMRRLADLKLEKEYGVLGGGEVIELATPEAASADSDSQSDAQSETQSESQSEFHSRSEPLGRPRAAGIADHSESDAAFERRAAGQESMTPSGDVPTLELPGEQAISSSGPLEAIEIYDKILEAYPTYPHNDQVLYQKARAFDELGRVDEAVAVGERLIAEYPHSRHIDEALFRRAEYFFVRKRYLEAEEAYSAIAKLGETSEYFELALYKLGWAFYKQELHEEALGAYITLLDHKVSTGYDFDQTRDEGDERRIADTYRVISLSVSNLGGPETIEAYFSANGHRSYEHRIYSHLGEFYLEKRRYHDAAAAYKAFVALNPLHRSSPHFGMRVVEIYETGEFPKLVVESKKEFAARYGLQAEYWRHFEPQESPEVLSYLRSNLEDLANHYHALYQEAELADEAPANFFEASRWYRAYLTSFPAESETPSIHYRLSGLLLEHRDFAEAALEYERTAYDYPEHDRAPAAGYAAIFAHRQNQKVAVGASEAAAKQQAVTSTLRFVETFPEHEHAAAVLGAAVDDLYDMKTYELAIATARELIDSYPDSVPAIRRSAWTVVAHASFDLSDYPEAEDSYARVLEMSAADDESRDAIVENLAAAIYKQGELANLAEDHRSAADHFLRIAQVAPASEIRGAAEYDAGAALIQLEDWSEAATVLESFRQAHPDHALHAEATKQMAFVYKKEGDLTRAAGEYERVADEAEDPELRREALLVAGDLYEESKQSDRALSVYGSYVSEFPEPIETAVETRFKMAEMYEAAQDEASRRDQLQRIVEIDASAGDQRTPRIRYLAANSALVLSEGFYLHFEEVDLVQPFDRNLQEKQRRMNTALEEFGRLVEYEVAEVTAAATFYMAEVYREFSRALLSSERPGDLAAAALLEYEEVLETEAFPFEERAIEVHEKNVELMAAGLYNRWIQKSLARLAELMPGRYAKFEASTGLIASIDIYSYRAPSAPTPKAPAESAHRDTVPNEGVDTVHVEPLPAFEEQVVSVEPLLSSDDQADSVEPDPSAENEAAIIPPLPAALAPAADPAGVIEIFPEPAEEEAEPAVEEAELAEEEAEAAIAEGANDAIVE
jgi:tetratricopeptide (TPR) repeat protein